MISVIDAPAQATEDADLGYWLDPADATDLTSHHQLWVWMRAAPTQRHYDPEQVECRVVTYGGFPEALTLHHHWTRAERYRFCIGGIDLNDRKHRREHFYAFGGDLTITATPAGATLCRFVSPAPILAISEQSHVPDIFVNEVEATLAEARAAWAVQHRNGDFDARLCQASPLALYCMCLRTAAEHRVAQQARLERDMMKSLANTDSLTALKNRRGLNEALVTLVPRATTERLLAIYMLDLDGFKPVNDLYGHDVGDELLVAIAGRLTATVQSRDIVARVGGDEFVIVATELASVATAADLGQRLLAAFQAPFRQGELDCRVGVTIGYVLVPQDGTQIADLLKAADAAMYAGKQRGKGVTVRGAL